MPELAEVQILAEQLHDALAGSRILGLEVRRPEWLRAGQAAQLEGVGLQAVDRWGKRLRFVCQGPVLVSGLGMTGGWLLEDPGRHVIAELRTDRGSAWYIDPRRFGRAYVFADAEEAQQTLGGRIGVDALADLSDDELRAALRPGRMMLKAALLDQSRLAGIGNYLADEICWAIQRLPTTPTNQLDATNWQELNRARREVIRRALQHQGASFASYRHLDGKTGAMQEQMRVYGRQHQPCRRCGAPITKSVVAGRGTHWCPECQH